MSFVVVELGEGAVVVDSELVESVDLSTVCPWLDVEVVVVLVVALVVDACELAVVPSVTLVAVVAAESVVVADDVPVSEPALSPTEIVVRSITALYASCALTWRSTDFCGEVAVAP